MFSLTCFSGNTAFNPSLVDQQKETLISNLLDRLFIYEEIIDSAFEITKTIESSVSLHFMLSDVCNAYLKLQTEDGCKKAYEVAKFKEQKKANVYKLLDSIIEVCICLKTLESISLAEEIYNDNSESLKYSSHKNDFLMAKEHIEHLHGKIKPSEKSRRSGLVAQTSQIIKTVAQRIDFPQIKSKEVFLPGNDADPIKESIFNSLKTGDLVSLSQQLSCLDPLQKSKYLSSTIKIVIPWVGGEEEVTPLQFAGFLGSIEAVKLLIEYGASANDFRDTSDSTQRSSLHFALDPDHRDHAFFLISKAKFKKQKEANVYKLWDSIIEPCIRKTLESKILTEEIYNDNIEHLHGQNKPTEKSRRSGMVAQTSQIIKTVAQRIDFPQTKSKEVFLPGNDADPIKESIFNSLKTGDVVSLSQQLSCLDPLQKSKYFSSTLKIVTPWVGGEEDVTPLQFACFLGSIEAVKLLIEYGASANDFRDTSDSTQRSSLHFAIDSDHLDIALFLISKGAVDRLASCATHHALKKYQLPNEFGGSFSCLSALHMSIIKNWHEVSTELLKNGYSKIEVKASGINSPLHLAARGGDEQMVKLLLSFGAQATLNLKDSSKKTPKEVALGQKHEHLLSLLS